MMRLKGRSKKCTLIVMYLKNSVMTKSLIKQLSSRRQISNSIFQTSLANRISLHFSKVKNQVINNQAMKVTVSINLIRHKYLRSQTLKYNRKRKARLISSTMTMLTLMIQYLVVVFQLANSSIPYSSNMLKKQRDPHSKTHSWISSVVPSRNLNPSTTHIRYKHHLYLTHSEASLRLQPSLRNNHKTIISPSSSNNL